MKIIIYLFFLVAIISVLIGCQAHHRVRSQTLVTGKNKAYHFNYDATRRGSFVSYDSVGRVRVLSEVPPDAVVSTITDLTNKLSAKINGQDFSAEQVTRISESISELGKRTVAVSILRDALYRLEEMTFAGSPMDTANKQLFLRVLAVTSEIAQAEIAAEKTKQEEQKTLQDKLLKETEQIKNEGEKAKQQVEVTRIIENKSAGLDNIYVSASEWESKGLNSLLDKDVEGALEAFQNAYEIYPTFHNVYEIKNLINSKKEKLKNERAVEWNELMKIIYEKYSWGIPSSTKTKIKATIK